MVSYLNSRPFLAGLEGSSHAYHIIADSPAGLAGRLQAGEVDVALLPVAVIPHLPQAYIVSRYGIAADGPVKTVAVFSEVPIEELTTIYLDYQSRSSVQLLQILCREYWQVKPHFAEAYPGYEGEIGGTRGGLVIGDRAIHLLDQFPYVYDLSEAWKQHTGLPFVFAAWVSVRPVETSVVIALDEAFYQGLQQRENIAEAFRSYNNARFTTRDYLLENIRYELDDRTLEGMQLFLQKYAEAISVEAVLPELLFRK